MVPTERRERSLPLVWKYLFVDGVVALSLAAMIAVLLLSISGV